MNQILAYLFLTTVIVITVIPIIGYIRSKYYYVDTKPIHYWLNKKTKIKKRYRNFKRRNRKHLSINKIGSYNRKYNYYKLNKHNL